MPPETNRKGAKGGRATRSEIVAAADRLIYESGYGDTSFSDIADAVGMSRGNFYYHFRTKDAILDAVIDERQAATRAMLEGWAAEADDPIARICAFIRILIVNGEKIREHGCPVGTLCNELAKLDHNAFPGAVEIFAQFRDWLTERFTELGRGEEAQGLALRVLAFSQGAATLYTAFRDDTWVATEVDRMCAWVHELAAQ
ncbi:TetR/AcrR family transcriptional regulator [Sphingobium fluviale]|uniref:TetR/AcrR family transcriptional regulator n=1 Tax=Sphingobium fluviale TaxID=2506423 RepID=A0A4V1N3Y9_9SPHN|nr:TetR/AcrR family transcriptional regulator [Sphingobium fluviale]RXR30326.1 TetR/AcrR family transcriptional regulator [Sphingobium fluviale]